MADNDGSQPPPKRNLAREARLAEKLRQNLLKRKAQTRARLKDEPPEPEPGSQSD